MQPSLAPNGYLEKANKEKRPIEDARKIHSAIVEAAFSEFDPQWLARQLMEECIFPDGGTFNRPDSTRWGGYSDSDRSFCLSLAARVHALVSSSAFAPVFKPVGKPLATIVGEFLQDPSSSLLRVCLSGVSYEFRAREFLVNAVGRSLLNEARAGRFEVDPLLVFVDEAHNFLGRTIGTEDLAVRLDAFELIAREGRKFGLNICLATQRPRDLTEGVLSQMGTLIVHRLTNDRDRDLVERACGDIDKNASMFLANLRQGEAVLIGADFPIPMTVQVDPPRTRPASDGPNYQEAWR